MPVHVLQLADEVLHAVGVADDEQVGAQAADVFFAFEGEPGFAPVGLHVPVAGGGKAADGQHALDGWHEFALLQRFGHEGARSRGQIGQAGDPGAFVAVGVQQADAFSGGVDGKGAHGGHARVGAACRVGEDEAAKGA